MRNAYAGEPFAREVAHGEAVGRGRTQPSTTIPDSTTLYFGPWYERSPYFEATLRAECKAYDIYNHAYYDDPVDEYHHLLEHVTLWDVGVEHIVQIKGPDAGPDRARRARQRACVRGPVRRF